MKLVKTTRIIHRELQNDQIIMKNSSNHHSNSNKVLRTLLMIKIKYLSLRYAWYEYSFNWTKWLNLVCSNFKLVEPGCPSIHPGKNLEYQLMGKNTGYIPEIVEYTGKSIMGGTRTFCHGNNDCLTNSKTFFSKIS